MLEWKGDPWHDVVELRTFRRLPKSTVRAYGRGCPSDNALRRHPSVSVKAATHGLRVFIAGLGQKEHMTLSPDAPLHEQRQ